MKRLFPEVEFGILTIWLLGSLVAGLFAGIRSISS
jgi:hypothetical protein